MKKVVSETQIIRKEVALSKNDRLPIAGSGIMMLNTQIKKRLPELSIDERSKLAVDVWSKMSDEEHEDLLSQGLKGWICEPRRKEFSTSFDKLESYVKNHQHRVTFQKSVSLVEVPHSGMFKSVLINLQTDSKLLANNYPISAASRDDMQTIARALAEEVSTLSAEIPESYQSKSKATTDKKERVALVVKKMNNRKERLKAYAAEMSIGDGRTTGEVIRDCIGDIRERNEAVKEQMKPIRVNSVNASFLRRNIEKSSHT